MKTYHVGPLNQSGPKIRVEANDQETDRELARPQLEKMGVSRNDPLLVDLPPGDEPE